METSYGRLGGQDRTEISNLIESVMRTPGSWLNMSLEEIEDEETPTESFLFGFLAARGPANPLVTVMRETADKPISVGIQHRAGTKAAAQLREAAQPVPEGARVRQDHPRRGLVVEWTEVPDADALTDWLLPAVRVLNRARTSDSLVWEWRKP